MKSQLIKIIFIMSFNTLFAQGKNYTVTNNLVSSKKIKSEFTTLKISNNASKSFVTKVIAPFIANQIPKVPGYISKIISNSKKKYVAEYGAKNTLDFKTSNASLPSLTLKRYINTIDNDTVLANKIELQSKIVHDNLLAFYVDDVSLKYSKAKLKNNYTHIVLLVEITATYAKIQEDKSLKKIEVTSSPLKITLDVASGKSINKTFKENLSDVFSTDNILNISVKITETNPYKIQLEKLESFADDYKEPIANFFTKLGESIKK